MKLVGYLRVSRLGDREEDDESFISPALQRERCEGWATALNHEIVSWVEDLDVSGKTPPRERPGYAKAFEAVEAGEAEGIICARLDRFSRSVHGALDALHELEEAGGVLLAVDVQLDPTTPSGQLMRGLLLLLSEWQLQTIREGWLAARSRKIRRGHHITAHMPFGYQRGPEGGLIPDPVNAPLLTEVFRRRAAGTPIRDLAIFLDENVPRPNGGVWPERTVWGMLGRRVYLGMAYSGEMVEEDAHPALVTQDEWEAAQPTEVRGYVTSERVALLAGFIRCAACGHAMSRSGTEPGSWVYRCRRRSADGICPAPATAGGRRLEGIILKEYREQSDRYLFRLARGRIGETYDAAVARVAQAEKELATWRDSGLLTELGRDAFLAGYTTREAQVDTTRAALEKTARPDALVVKSSVDLLDDPERFRGALEASLKMIYVTRGRPPGVRIEWRPDFGG